MGGPPRRDAERRDRSLAPPRYFRHSGQVAGRDWKNLAQHVISRRVELGYRSTRHLAKVAGITEKTMGRLELGYSVRSGTLAAVERVLGWAPGSMDALLAGGEPRMAGVPPREFDVTHAPTVDIARQRVLEATHRQLAEIALFIEGVEGPAVAEDWLRKAFQLRGEHSGAEVADRDRTA